MFHRYIASRICLHCLNALTKKILTHRSDEAMNSIGNFQTNRYFHYFRSKAEKYCRFCLYICVLPCFMVISAWIYTMLTAMKRGDEALEGAVSRHRWPTIADGLRKGPRWRDRTHLHEYPTWQYLSNEPLHIHKQVTPAIYCYLLCNCNTVYKENYHNSRHSHNESTKSSPNQRL